jgi:hypothetical protein
MVEYGKMFQLSIMDYIKRESSGRELIFETSAKKFRRRLDINCIGMKLLMHPMRTMLLKNFLLHMTTSAQWESRQRTPWIKA